MQSYGTVTVGPKETSRLTFVVMWLLCLAFILGGTLLLNYLGELHKTSINLQETAK